MNGVTNPSASAPLQGTHSSSSGVTESSSSDRHHRRSRSRSGSNSSDSHSKKKKHKKSKKHRKSRSRSRSGSRKHSSSRHRHSSSSSRSKSRSRSRSHSKKKSKKHHRRHRSRSHTHSRDRSRSNQMSAPAYPPTGGTMPLSLPPPPIPGLPNQLPPPPLPHNQLPPPPYRPPQYYQSHQPQPYQNYPSYPPHRPQQHHQPYQSQSYDHRSQHRDSRDYYQRDQGQHHHQQRDRQPYRHESQHQPPSAQPPASSNPLNRRPPPPPFERPTSLLDHVRPEARGKYAYVFLVMKGDSYALGAIIGAYSLRLAGTKHSTVCMVTPDVSEECRKRMRFVFTEVVEIPYLQYEVKPLRTHKQRSMYNSWVDAAFTKWNMLSLVQYEKTLFVDADKICISNMDHLFEEMNTPAGTFSSPWSQPFVGRKDAIAQRKGESGRKPGYNNAHKGMTNPYQYCDHNSRVTSAMIYSGLTEQSFVVIGTVVLLSPNLEDYEQYKSMLTTLVPFGFEDCHSMMDEQSLSYYFGIYKNQLIERGVYGQLTHKKEESNGTSTTIAASSTSLNSSTSSISEWSYIHHCYNYVPWHRYWLGVDEVPYVFHFFNLKPWDLDRKAYLDLEAWWELVMALLKDESFTQEQRDILRAVYPAAMLAQPKIEGCCWCRFSEESFMLEADGSWKKHNVFDANGHLQCPAMKAGFERNAKKRQLLAAANKTTATTNSSTVSISNADSVVATSTLGASSE